MKYLKYSIPFLLTLATLTAVVPTNAGASTTAKDRVAVVCYSSDPVILVTGAGNWAPGAATRIPCESGVPAPGQGAVLRYQINGAGVGWDTSSGAPYNGATLLLNTIGSKVWMAYRIINGHVWCPLATLLNKYGISCLKSTYGFPNERAADGT